MSQNRFSVRHPIQSEKYGDAKSHMSTSFVPYFKDNYYEQISEYIIYLYQKGINRYFFSNLNAKSVAFPVTGEVMS